METNRRYFLRDLGLGLSAMVFAPKIIKPTFRDTLRFNRPEILVQNPAWFEAPYEVTMFTYKNNCQPGYDGVWVSQLIRRVEVVPDHVKSTPPITICEFHEMLKKQCALELKDPFPMRLNWDKTYIPHYIKA